MCKKISVMQGKKKNSVMKGRKKSSANVKEGKYNKIPPQTNYTALPEY
jgi:hypothetical protein